MTAAAITDSLLDALATPVLRLDLAGDIRDLNVAAAGWLGVSRRRLFGLHAAALERDGTSLAEVLAQAPQAPMRLRRIGLAFPGSEQMQFADLWLTTAEQGYWLEMHPVDEFPGSDPADVLPSALAASLKGLAHELRNPLGGSRAPRSCCRGGSMRTAAS